MAAESSRSSSSADSYIGSLISLTSKSEMRYEGVLYNINTEESSIGLRNVRSFGTEGRKKDGPQVPPSDKVYEYIVFRGSDIKDLQVKASPPAQTGQPINNDLAIQSHYPPRPASTSSSLPSAVRGSLTDASPHTGPLGLPGLGFQGGLPLYQPGGNIGSWGTLPPPPSANGNGLSMPIYWQGFYGPTNGLPHFHQQSLLGQPPGLSMPSSMQQPMQYSGFNLSLSAGASNLAGSNLPEYPSPLLPGATGSLNLIPTSLPNLTSTSLPNLTSTPLPPSTLPSALPPVPTVTLAPEAFPSSIPNRAPTAALPAVTLSASLPILSPVPASKPDTNAAVLPIASKPNVISAPTLRYENVSDPTPLLVTPGQLLQSAPAAVSSAQSSQTAPKHVKVVQVSSTPSEKPAPVSTEAQPPILPLPQPSQGGQKLDGASYHNHNSYRGLERGRGPGSSRPVTKFAEDFDFMAMNEKFSKDEVWGYLGKTNKSHPRDNEGDWKYSNEDHAQDECDADAKFEIKSVYNKDDFFDSLSCNALYHESNTGRPRFSEQMKIDTETFGDFSRYWGGQRGRGGRYRATYYGRGYGYAGRGHSSGWGTSSHAL